MQWVGQAPGVGLVWRENEVSRREEDAARKQGGSGNNPAAGRLPRPARHCCGLNSVVLRVWELSLTYCVLLSARMQ